MSGRDRPHQLRVLPVDREHSSRGRVNRSRFPSDITIAGRPASDRAGRRGPFLDPSRAQALPPRGAEVEIEHS